MSSGIIAEAVYLLLKSVFDLGYRRVEWVCSVGDAATRDAALRLGFAFEGTHRQSFVTKNGRNGDDHYFGVLDRDWEALSRAYMAWLANEITDEGDPTAQLEWFVLPLTAGG